MLDLRMKIREKSLVKCTVLITCFLLADKLLSNYISDS